jgi:hypothetical protein
MEAAMQRVVMHNVILQNLSLMAISFADMLFNGSQDSPDPHARQYGTPDDGRKRDIWL